MVEIKPDHQLLLKDWTIQGSFLVIMQQRAAQQKCSTSLDDYATHKGLWHNLNLQSWPTVRWEDVTGYFFFSYTFSPACIHVYLSVSPQKLRYFLSRFFHSFPQSCQNVAKNIEVLLILVQSTKVPDIRTWHTPSQYKCCVHFSFSLSLGTSVCV